MKDDIYDSFRNVRFFDSITIKPKEYTYGCCHVWHIKRTQVAYGVEFMHYKCDQCGKHKDEYKKIEQPKKEEKKMITKKSLKKDIDDIKSEMVGLSKKNIFDIEVEINSDVEILKCRQLAEVSSVLFTVPALKEKASKKSVEDLLKNVQGLTDVVEKQLVLIKRLCPHKDVELSKEELTGALSIAYRHCKMKPFAYTKKCKLCGHSEMISEKEYYSIQKAIIDSKVEELK